MQVCQDYSPESKQILALKKIDIKKKYIRFSDLKEASFFSYSLITFLVLKQSEVHGNPTVLHQIRNLYIRLQVTVFCQI